jgi:anti-sigma B factor antagonist
MKYFRIDGDNQTILRVAGSLDALSAPKLMPAIDAIADDGCPQVIVDLSELDMIDSSGVAAIVALYKRVRARGGQVKVAGAHDQPLSIFRLLRMDRVFSI